MKGQKCHIYTCVATADRGDGYIGGIPTEDDFRKSLDEASVWAKEAGYK